MLSLATPRLYFRHRVRSRIALSSGSSDQRFLQSSVAETVGKRQGSPTYDTSTLLDFTYPTPDDELHDQLALQLLERRGPGQWTQVDTFSADALLFALRESGLLRLRRRECPSGRGAIRIRSKSRSELSADALKPVQERVRALSPETRSHKSP